MRAGGDSAGATDPSDPARLLAILRPDPVTAAFVTAIADQATIAPQHFLR
jgi:hypothetical protein